jgi:hypothetical protein
MMSKLWSDNYFNPATCKWMTKGDTDGKQLVWKAKVICSKSGNAGAASS